MTNNLHFAWLPSLAMIFVLLVPQLPRLISYPRLIYEEKKPEINTKYYEQWVSESGGAYLLPKEPQSIFYKILMYQFTCPLCHLPFLDTGQTFYPAFTNTLLLQHQFSLSWESIIFIVWPLHTFNFIEVFSV